MVEKTVVALAVDKVQTFLTEVIHSHVQEKQTESETLSSIVNASQGISGEFHTAVKDKFKTEELDGFQELLACSGVYIFTCSMEADEIEGKIDELFLYYYRQSQGQKLLKGVCFAAGGRKEIVLIQEAKKRLKQADCFNKIVERNKDKLFSFQPVKQKTPEEEHKEAQEAAQRAQKDKTKYPCFAETINKLFYDTGLKEDPRYHGVKEDNKNRFQIAVIKADLDGMGKLFQEIQDYQTYQDVSKALNECISLDSLHTAAEKEKPQNKTDWLFPLYIAGDDIFFAVGVGHLFQGIDVCRRILDNVNQKLAAVSERLHLTLSIGVEVTVNRQPIRYYMEMVEDQLKNAKKATVPKALEKFTHGKISIGGLTFFDVDNANQQKEFKQECQKDKSVNPKNNVGDHEKEKDVILNCDQITTWAFFEKCISLLHDMQDMKSEYNDNLATPSFFYTLLEWLTEQTVQNDTYKYINRVLYHLLPRYLENPNRKLVDYEMLLNSCILKQLYQPVEKEKSEGNQDQGEQKQRAEQIGINTETKRRLEGYLRLMVLFSDTRFHMLEYVDLREFKKFEKNDINQSSWDFLKNSVDYLYDIALTNAKTSSSKEEKSNKEDLRDVFIRVKNKQDADKKGKRMQLLHIHKSMFFKLRNTTKVRVDKAANMIGLLNTDGKKEKLSDKSKKKGPSPFYFDKSKFIKYAPAAWTPDFVDSLMLLYTYHDVLKQFKKLNVKKGKGKKQNGKRDSNSNRNRV